MTYELASDARVIDTDKIALEQTVEKIYNLVGAN